MSDGGRTLRRSLAGDAPEHLGVEQSVPAGAVGPVLAARTFAGCEQTVHRRFRSVIDSDAALEMLDLGSDEHFLARAQIDRPLGQPLHDRRVDL